MKARKPVVAWAVADADGDVHAVYRRKKSTMAVTVESRKRGCRLVKLIEANPDDVRVVRAAIRFATNTSWRNTEALLAAVARRQKRGGK